MKNKIDAILEQFEISGKRMVQATLSGDYKTNNKEGNKLLKVFKEFERNKVLAQQCIPLLLESENIIVKTKAASYCLALNWNIPEAMETLEIISENPSNGIFGFNAKMVLKMWHDNGCLSLYKSRKK